MGAVTADVALKSNQRGVGVEAFPGKPVLIVQQKHQRIRYHGREIESSENPLLIHPIGEHQGQDHDEQWAEAPERKRSILPRHPPHPSGAIEQDGPDQRVARKVMSVEPAQWKGVEHCHIHSSRADGVKVPGF